MEYGGILDRVLDYTKRPDLEDIAKTAIQHAIRRFQLAASFPDDRITVTITPEDLLYLLGDQSPDPGYFKGYVTYTREILISFVDEDLFGTTVSGIRGLEYVTDHDIPCPQGSYPRPPVKEYLSQPLKYPRAAIHMGQGVRVVDPNITVVEDEYGDKSFSYKGPGHVITFMCYRNAFMDDLGGGGGGGNH